MKKIFNFVKNNVFLIFAAYWFIDFVIGFITFKTSTLDDTAKKIKTLQLGMDMIWSILFLIEHSLIRVANLIKKKIKWLDTETEIIIDIICEIVNKV